MGVLLRLRKCEAGCAPWPSGEPKRRFSSANSSPGEAFRFSCSSALFSCLTSSYVALIYKGVKRTRFEALEVKLPSTAHSGDRLSLQNGINGLARDFAAPHGYGLNTLSTRVFSVFVKALEEGVCAVPRPAVSGSLQGVKRDWSCWGARIARGVASAAGHGSAASGSSFSTCIRSFRSSLNSTDMDRIYQSSRATARNPARSEENCS